MKKITILIMLIFSIVAYAQDGYNEKHQFIKIKSELEKHYNTNNNTHFFYRLISIKDNILKVEKFSYLPKTKIRHLWTTLDIPMSKMDTEKPKYRRGILIYTKEKKNIITTYNYKNTKPNEKKLNVLNIHPRAGKKRDKEIMQMLITLFKNH